MCGVVCPFSFLLWLAANGEFFLSLFFFYRLLSRSGFLLSCFSYLDSLSTCIWELQQYMTTVAAMTSFADHGASLNFLSFYFLECCIIVNHHTKVNPTRENEDTAVLPSDNAGHVTAGFISLSGFVFPPEGVSHWQIALEISWTLC